MDLDDLIVISKLDSYVHIRRIQRLPEHLQAGWELGLSLPMPTTWSDLRRILICGMGKSALAGELAAMYVFPHSPIPVSIHRGYSLPAYAQARETLVLFISQSGETEETLAMCAMARRNRCSIALMCGEGSLLESGLREGSLSWKLDVTINDGAWLEFLSGALLAFFFRMDLIPDPRADLQETIETLRTCQANLIPEVRVANNPAKRLAGQLIGRIVCIFAGDEYAAVAQYWKNRLHLSAKNWGQIEIIPEADHNSLIGVIHPEEALSRLCALFLISPTNHPRSQMRLDFTRQAFMLQGINTDFIRARGENRLAHIWTLLQFAEYTSYYLGISNGEDPGCVDSIHDFKTEFGKI